MGANRFAGGCALWLLPETWSQSEIPAPMAASITSDCARWLRSCGGQPRVPLSEQESCTTCLISTPGRPTTKAMQSLSRHELRKLGVIMENFMVEFFNTGPGCWQIMLDIAAATSISNQLDTNEFF